MAGLTYVPDYAADPRGTGYIVGPCGVGYANVESEVGGEGGCNSR